MCLLQFAAIPAHGEIHANNHTRYAQLSNKCLEMPEVTEVI